MLDNVMDLNEHLTTKSQASKRFRSIADGRCVKYGANTERTVINIINISKKKKKEESNILTQVALNHCCCEHA